jgi:hypothetical protein
MIESIARMEKAIDTERDPIKRWAMRRVLKDTIEQMEKENAA